MPSLLIRIVLFVSSYAPLLVLFGLLDSFHNEAMRWVCIGVAVLSVIALRICWVRARKLPRVKLSITAAKPRDIEVLGFFATYVIPFTTVPSSDVTRQLGLVVFLIVTGGLYLANDLYYINPVLALCGVRVFEVTTKSGAPALVLTKKKFMQQKDDISVVRIGERIYLS